MEATSEGTKACPFCREAIRLSAIKCRFCNEMLTGLSPGDQVVTVGPARSDRTPAPRRSAFRTWLGLVVVVVLGVSLYRATRSDGERTAAPSTKLQPRRDEPSRAPVPASSFPLHAKPQVIVDEELAVTAGGWQSRGFTLRIAAPIQVQAQGTSHADKGFTVYVMETSEIEKLKRRETFMHVGALQGLKVRSFSQTARLSAGKWTVVVVNSENIINTMLVRLRVVSDPEM